MLEISVYYLTSFIMAFTEILCYKNIYKNSLKLKPIVIIVLLLGSIINTLLYPYNTIIKPLYSLFFFGVLIFVTFKPEKKTLTYYTIIMWLYGLIIDFLVMLLMSAININNIIMYIELIYVQLIFGIVMALILYLTTRIPLLQKSIRKLVDKLISMKLSLLFDFLICLLLIILNVFCFLNLNKLSIQFFVIVIVLLLILFVLAIIDKNYNVSKLKQVNEVLLNNNDFFIKLDTDYRVLKHNLTHQLNSIKSVANDKTKELIDDLIISYNSNFVSTRDIGKIPKGINGLIYEKLYTFEDKEIEFVVENSLESDLIESIKPRTYNNLCETLGVLIDNALEATHKSKDKSLLIDFYETKDSIRIKIINTFSDMIDIDKIGSMNYSTKKQKKRGIGLFSIFKNNNLKVKNTIVNNLFISEIKLKKVL